MRFRNIILGFAIIVTIVSCYKDNVDIAQLNTNPWDLEFNGVDLLKVDSAYFDSIYVKTYITQFDTIDSTTTIIDSVENLYYENHIRLVVNNTLFDDNLSQPYSLWMESNNGFRRIIAQDSIGGPHQFNVKQTTKNQGEELCYFFALSRNETRSKGINFCNTNPY